MSAIAEFPEDDNLWLIKCCDGYRMPHRSTSSASVAVLLQKLPFNDPKKLSRLSEFEVQDILRDKPDETNPLFLSPCPEVHVAIMPLLYVGAVYKNKQHVGDLPSTRKIITLPDAEESCTARSFGEELPPITGWTAGPYRVLNKFEYSYRWDLFSRSKCIIRIHEGVEYIIPRSVIFRTFYAAHYKLARAFTNGSWPDRLKDLIFTGTLESGLKTEIDSESGRWNIILQLNVPTGLAPLLAIYYFDEHGRKCAESIYSNARKSCGSRGLNLWHCEAEIPFRASSKPLRLDVRGHMLRPYFKADESAVSRFLVTKITSSSFPEYVPDMGWEFTISSKKGGKQIEVDEPPPFSGPRQPKPPNGNTTIDSEYDSNLELQATELFRDTFQWMEPPRIERLVKGQNNTYVGTPRPPKPESSSGDQVSSGNNTGSQASLPEGQAQVLLREPEKRFQYLEMALSELKKKGDISNFAILAPIDSTQLMKREGITCWSFLDEDSRRTGIWPSHDWRLIVSSKPLPNGTRLRGEPRTALVVEIEYGALIGYWIEIACKHGGYNSAFLYDIQCEWPEAITHCLELIARAKGRNIGPVLTAGMSELGGGSIAVYRHQHKSKDSPEFEPTSILRFLKKLSS